MRPSRLALAGAATIVIAGLGISGVASATSGTTTTTTSGDTAVHVDGDQPAGASTLPVSTAPSTPATLTLVTGEQVRVDGGSVTPLDNTSAPLMSFDWNGDTYAIPTSTIHYLGSSLDVRLFDVSYLAKLGGSAPVTVTGGGTGGATPAGAAAATTATLAATLGAQIAAGTLPAGTHIALAQKAGAPALPSVPASATPPAAAGGLDYETLTVNTLDRTGAPGEAMLVVQNVDDASLFTFFDPITPSEGSQSFSVPAGNYSVEAVVLTPQGNGFTAALVADPQFAVHHDTTITLDAQQALPYQPTLDPAITTPPYRIDQVRFTRTSRTSGSFAASGFLLAALRLTARTYAPVPRALPSELYATPSATATEGVFGYESQTLFFDGDVQTDPSYVLSFPHKASIPATISHQIGKSQLTTVNNDIYNPPGTTGNPNPTTLIYEPWDPAPFEDQITVPPGEHVDYWYSGDPANERWQIRMVLPDAVLGFVGLDSSYYSVRAGATISNTWGKGPRVPAPAAQTQRLETPDETTLCPACRQDDNALVEMAAFGDSDPSHYGKVPVPAAAFTVRFSRNGTLALTYDTTPTTLSPDSMVLPLLSQPARYDLDWATTWNAPAGSSTDTDWSFTSSPSDSTTLPAAEKCLPDPTRSCSALPLLFITYDLALDHQSQAPAGAPFTVAFTVGSAQGAPAPRGVGASVSVSYDDGATWSAPQQAQAGPGGRFSLGIQHPDATGYVSLRVNATDGAGNSVRQTIIRAYQLTSQEG